MVDLSKKVELFSSRVIVETLRQWFELIIGLTMLAVFIMGAIKLRKTLKSWFILDIILILMLAFRVILYLVFEFLMPSRVLTFAADNIYILVLLMMYYSFARSLETQMHKYFNRRTYLGVILFILVANTIFSFATFNDSFH